MIYVDIVGGLGNQMFQYAAGRTLAEKYNTNLNLLADYESYKLHPYSLPNFNIKGTVGDYSKAPKIRFEEDRRGSNLLYKKEFEALPDGIRLCGYFQNEKYFYSIKNKIIEEFSLPLENMREIRSRMPNKKCCSIHVRRGDYLLPKNQRIFGMVTKEYYIEAIKTVKEKIGINTFFVFSNDVEWCKENFTDGEFFFAEKGKDYEDILMMALCEAHIIPNSTFSWWGAWLGENGYGSEIVIAPAKWFAANIPIDIVPDRWIKL